MDIISRFPKADVHLHFESLSNIELVFDIASRNSITPPLTKAECYEKIKNFSCLDDLLELLNVFFSVPCSPQDIYEILMFYYKQISTKNIVYIEPQIKFNGYIHVTPEEVMKGAIQASAEAETLYGIKTGLILNFTRGVPVDKQEAILYSLQNYKQHIAGVGVAGNEYLMPSRQLKPLYDLARNLGFCDNNNTTAHTGEETPPNYIIESLRYLGIKRMDHAVRAREDPYLMKFLGDNNFPIAMCPISNDIIKVNERFCEGKHCYEEFIEKGCMISINSDDPEALGMYLDEVWASCFEKYQGNRDNIVQNYAEIAKNGFRMAFMQEADKKYWIDQIDSELSKVEIAN